MAYHEDQDEANDRHHDSGFVVLLAGLRHMHEADFMTLAEALALDSRELDALVATEIMGLEKQTIQPDWYPHPVDLFIHPKNGLIVYSYDENACNAMMHRNGKDDSDGTAQPLPSFSCDVESLDEILLSMDIDPETFCRDQCFAALRAKGVIE